MDGAINLIEALATQARALVTHKPRQARARFERLLSFANLPIHARIDAHRALAELHLDAQRYQSARRHLSTVLVLKPNSAEAHYELAMAVEADPKANPKRAYALLVRAVGMCDNVAEYWAARAQVALRLGRRRAARLSLERAADLRAESCETVADIVDGLLHLGRYAKAEAAVRAAQFRWGMTPDVERLRRAVQMARSRRKVRVEAGGRRGTALLPFPTLDPAVEAPRILRFDRGCRPTPVPHRACYRPDPGSA